VFSEVRQEIERTHLCGTRAIRRIALNQNIGSSPTYFSRIDEPASSFQKGGLSWSFAEDGYRSLLDVPM